LLSQIGLGAGNVEIRREVCSELWELSGYRGADGVTLLALQKLVDLRLVHLIHPSITPGKAGERYEAYLLDYSFYTGVRRRHGLSELKIRTKEPPKYAELRKLRRIELGEIVPPTEGLVRGAGAV